MKGEMLLSNELIKNAHNSFKRPEPLIMEGKRPAKEDDDVFHFISYLPFKGKIYELDGLQKGPISLGSYDIDKPDSWLEIAKNEINLRILKYSQNEVHFNLLAIVSDKRT